MQVIERNDLTCEESYSLYERYINTRHADGDMYPATPEQFEAFIKTKTVDTRFFMFYQESRLIMVSVSDILDRGLSAVYTFFDPEQKWRGPGTLAILHQVELTRQIEYDWLYLGYWIENCSKMSYKENFSPLQAFDAEIGDWRDVA